MTALCAEAVGFLAFDRRRLKRSALNGYIVPMKQENANVKKENRLYRNNARLGTLDLLRGLTLVSMILYHGLWDLLYLSGTGADMPALKAWYEGTGGHLWQQSICRTFILLSGFCVPFSKHIIRRGLQVSLAGCAVTAVTILFLYEERVVFGVLTFLGMAMLLTGVLKRFFGKKDSPGGACPSARGTGTGQSRCRDGFPAACPSARQKNLYAFVLLLCVLFFHITRWVNAGFLRIGPFLSPAFPAALYKEGPAGLFLTALGFPMPGFFSTDYFSLIPWIFLFWAGMFLHLLMDCRRETASWKTWDAFHLNVPVLNWMGRHSLLVYLLHQPLLYLLTAL